MKTVIKVGRTELNSIGCLSPLYSDAWKEETLIDVCETLLMQYGLSKSKHRLFAHIIAKGLVQVFNDNPEYAEQLLSKS